MNRSKSVICMLAILLVICLSLVRISQAQNATKQVPERLVFSATPGPRGILYKMEGRSVPDPLRAFGLAIEKYGADLPVVCLIDSRLPIQTVGEAAGTAGKAGFKNVRSFAVDHGTGEVSEIKFGPWTPEPK